MSTDHLPPEIRAQLAAQAEAERTPDDKALFDQLAAAVRKHKERERASIRAEAYRDAAAQLDQRASSLDALSSSDHSEEAYAVRKLADAANALRARARADAIHPEPEQYRTDADGRPTYAHTDVDGDRLLVAPAVFLAHGNEQPGIYFRTSPNGSSIHLDDLPAFIARLSTIADTARTEAAEESR
jgi:hypothetical protein